MSETPFDADWYLRTYPDVAASGLAPRDHYDRIGRLLGRRCGPDADIPPASVAPTSPRAAAATLGRPRAIEPIVGPGSDGPLTDRPANFNPGVPAASGSAGGRVSVNDPIDALMLAAPSDGAAHAAPVELLRKMARGDLRGIDALAPDAMGPALRDGACAIGDVWFKGTLRLRLGDETAERAERRTIAAWQASPSQPGQLQRIGSATLPETGPFWFEAAPDNPYMPILLVLGDGNGMTLDVGVLPFPSLARGGRHAAEMALHRRSGVGVTALLRRGEALLAALGARDEAAIGVIEIQPRGATGSATGAEPIFDVAFGDWCALLFGLRPGCRTPAVREIGQDWLAEAYPGMRRPGARTLRLPCDHIPTLAALVAGAEDLPLAARAAAPFLVACAETLRPRWSVGLPAEAMPWLAGLQPDPHAAPCPILEGPVARTMAQTVAQTVAHPSNRLAPLPLSIAFRGPQPLPEARRLLRFAADAAAPLLPASAPEGPFSVALAVRDPDRAVRLLGALGEAAGRRDLDLLLYGPGAPALHETLDGAGQVLSADADTPIEAIAGRAAHAEILMLDDAIVLSEPRVLSVLRAMLAADASVASAACCLLQEARSGKKLDLKTATAGLFPISVSVMTAPFLVVGEPDPSEALPLATYPVLGNALSCAFVRRSALEATLPALRGVAPDMLETTFGLAASAAGYAHLATTVVALGLGGAPQTRRDEMDPLDLSGLRVRRWDDLLATTTLLQELR